MKPTIILTQKNRDFLRQIDIACLYVLRIKAFLHFHTRHFGIFVNAELVHMSFSRFLSSVTFLIVVASDETLACLTPLPSTPF